MDSFRVRLALEATGVLWHDIESRGVVCRTLCVTVAFKGQKGEMMSVLGGGLVVRTLRKLGVRHLFSLPGHQTLAVYDACLDEGLDLISTRHEASAVFMAQALAYATREPGVVLLAGGPELTNALTGIAQAFYANTPLLVISGSNTLQKRDKGFPQDMDQLAVVRPFTKWARSCHDVRRIPEYIANGYRQALRGRPGPAYVEIPYDIMETKVSTQGLRFPERPGRYLACGEKDSLRFLAAMLGEARRPLAIAGSGALWSEAEAELAAFTEKTGVPLYLTSGALAMPFPPQHVFGLGSMGAGRPSMEAIAEADLLLFLGTRVNFLLGFGQPPFISNRQKIVQVDIEPREIDSNRRVDLGIAGDLRTTLRAFNEMDVSLPALDRWRARLREKHAAFERQLQELAERATTPMHPMRLVKAVEMMRTDDSFLVLDGANSILWALLAARVKPQGGLVISTLGDLEAIGAGVPQALALQRANLGRQVILHTGDGSLGYGLMEMETAVRYGIPLVVVVHNDTGWGMTRDMQAEYFGEGRQIGNRLGTVRYDEVVAALGGHGEFVEQPEDLEPALTRALEAGVPACVNVMVDPEPKSPGLMMFMLMEVMLGKETYYDRIPEWMRRLNGVGLEGAATKVMLSYLDRMLHSEMG